MVVVVVMTGLEEGFQTAYPAIPTPAVNATAAAIRSPKVPFVVCGFEVAVDCVE